MRPPFYKRQYFINKELQGRYIFKYFLLFGFGSILFTLTISFFSSNTLSIVYDDYRLQLGTTPGILMDKILSTQWVLIVIGGIVMVVITMMLTHRIAGPFFRYEKTLNEMIGKNLSYEIFLRKNDEGKELGIHINTFNQMLSSDLHRLVNNCNQIEKWCMKYDTKQLSPGSDQAVGAPLDNTIKNLIQVNQQNLSILNDYKLFKE